MENASSRIRNSDGDRLAAVDRCSNVSREQAFTLPPGLTSSFGYVRRTGVQVESQSNWLRGVTWKTCHAVYNLAELSFLGNDTAQQACARLRGIGYERYLCRDDK